MSPGPGGAGIALPTTAWIIMVDATLAAPTITGAVAAARRGRRLAWLRWHGRSRTPTPPAAVPCETGAPARAPCVLAPTWALGPDRVPRALVARHPRTGRFARAPKSGAQLLPNAGWLANDGNQRSSRGGSSAGPSWLLPPWGRANAPLHNCEDP